MAASPLWAPKVLVLSAALGAVVAALTDAGRRAPSEPTAPERATHGATSADRVASLGVGGDLTRLMARRFRSPSDVADRGGADDVLATTDPQSANYDPARLATGLGLRASDIFNKEPRAAAFADRRERALQEEIQDRLRDLDPFDADIAVECRTSSCELTVSGPDGGNLNDALQMIELHTLGAEAAEIGFGPPAAGRRGLRATLLFSPALRDHKAFEEYLSSRGATDGPTGQQP
jgi:hypothetical protein